MCVWLDTCSMVSNAAAKRNVCRLVSPAVSQSVPTMGQLSLFRPQECDLGPTQGH